jgi:hypothetical protein
LAVYEGFTPGGDWKAYETRVRNVPGACEHEVFAKLLYVYPAGVFR